MIAATPFLLLCLFPVIFIDPVDATITPPRCNGTLPAPIPETSIGKVFSWLDDCYRPASTETLKVHRKAFLYQPLQPTLRTSGCFEKYVMHFQKPPTPPYIAYFPAFSPPLVNVSTSEDVIAYCKAEENKRRELFFVDGSGPSRDRFIAAVRLMAERVPIIRDFGCFQDDQGFIRQFPGRSFDNVDANPIITYLHHIAFTHGFCIA